MGQNALVGYDNFSISTGQFLPTTTLHAQHLMVVSVTYTSTTATTGTLAPVAADTSKAPNFGSRRLGRIVGSSLTQEVWLAWGFSGEAMTFTLTTGGIAARFTVAVIETSAEQTSAAHGVLLGSAFTSTTPTSGPIAPTLGDIVVCSTGWASQVASTAVSDLPGAPEGYVGLVQGNLTTAARTHVYLRLNATSTSTHSTTHTLAASTAFVGTAVRITPAGSGVVTAVDEFTRANGAGLGTAPDGRAWQILGGSQWQIASNRAYYVANDGPGSRQIAVLDLGSNDYRIGMRSSHRGDTALEFRVTDFNNRYYVADTVLVKVINGVGTAIGNPYGSTAWPDNYTGFPEVEVRGSTFRFYINGVLKATITDTSLPTGSKAGFSGGGAVRYFDDFTYTTTAAVPVMTSARAYRGRDTATTDLATDVRFLKGL